jgi:hypothetical protein
VAKICSLMGRPADKKNSFELFRGTLSGVEIVTFVSITRQGICQGRPGQRLQHHEHEVGVTSAHNRPVPGRAANTRMQARAGSMFCNLV